jgi:hypothetical protein
MIEMQWVQTQGAPTPGSICVGGNIFQKLQYRVHLPVVDAGGTLTPGDWTEWMDVPIGYIKTPCINAPNNQ